MTGTRWTLGAGLCAALGAALFGTLLGTTMAAGCGGSASSTKSEPRYTIVKPDESPPPTSGIPTDKEEEIRLVLQRYETTTRKCYQDVLNERQDRKLQGSVDLLISLGTDGRATAVKAAGGSLSDTQVVNCLIETVKSFEYPTLTQGGDILYTYSFRPAF